MEHSFWRGKRVLVTGHTGFKGSWLCVWLRELGAEVIGYGLGPYTERDNYVCCAMEEKIVDIRGDIRDAARLQRVFDEYQPELVFHLAAQPLVRRSYIEPVLTYETNVMGTLHVLESVRHTESVRAAVMITTDKCYENKETMTPYRETDALGGYDMYSSSKACDELLIASYRNSFLNPKDFEVHRKAVASVRAGNVIGGGDWSADRIVPDCVRAMEAGEAVEIRSPGAVRPWQFVLEPLYGYLLLAERLYLEPIPYSGGWNFGPQPELIVDVWRMAGEIAEAYGGGSVRDCSAGTHPHEAGLLLLDSTKAKEKLGWQTRLSFCQTIRMTLAWYQEAKAHPNPEMYPFCKEQIAAYSKWVEGVSERRG